MIVYVNPLADIKEETNSSHSWSLYAWKFDEIPLKLYNFSSSWVKIEGPF